MHRCTFKILKWWTEDESIAECCCFCGAESTTLYTGSNTPCSDKPARVAVLVLRLWKHGGRSSSDFSSLSSVRKTFSPLGRQWGRKTAKCIQSCLPQPEPGWFLVSFASDVSRDLTEAQVEICECWDMDDACSLTLELTTGTALGL